MVDNTDSNNNAKEFKANLHPDEEAALREKEVSIQPINTDQDKNAATQADGKFAAVSQGKQGPASIPPGVTVPQEGTPKERQDLAAQWKDEEAAKKESSVKQGDV